MMELRAWRALGSVRAGDYVREALGVSSRTIEEEALVARALRGLPRLAVGFLDAKIPWTKLRLLVSVAVPDDERQWMATADRCDTRELERIVRSHRKPPPASTGGGEPNDDSAPVGGPRENEDVVAFSVRLSREGRRLWRLAAEMAERNAGSRLGPAQVLELVAAEASSGASHAAPARTGFHRATGFGEDCGSAAGIRGNEAGASTDRENRAGNADARGPASGEKVGASTRADASTGTGGSTGTGASTFGGSAAFASSDPDEDVRARIDRHLNEICDAENITLPIGAATDPSSRRPDATDARTLDADLRQVGRSMQKLDAELASLLLRALESRLHRTRGFANFERYVEVHLGLCPRHAWTLIALERAMLRSCGDFATAFHEGRIGVLAAMKLLRVMSARHGKTWIERASVVTLRRLEAEVAWALDRRVAARGPEAFEPPAPPPLDHDLTSDGAPISVERIRERAFGCGGSSAQADPGEVAGARCPVQPANGATAATERNEPCERAAEAASAQSEAGPTPSDDPNELKMRAAADTADAEADSTPPDDPNELKMRAAGGTHPMSTLHLRVPREVAVLAEETMLSVRRGAESRGEAFERMVALALVEWMSAPKHRDPVFERDGWRCAVPGCSSRRNLHDHHIVFRSHGGRNGRDNRITVCAAHHLHGLHTGLIRATGTAPSAVLWQMPTATLLGDRYVRRA